MADDTDKPLVLIVDDDENDRLMMARVLRRAGFRVLQASDGDTGVQLFEESNPRAVILDLLMPRTGGLSVCRTLRAQPAGAQLPVLIVSGLRDPVTRRRAFDAGATDFIPKPDVGTTMEDYASIARRVHELIRDHGNATAYGG